MATESQALWLHAGATVTIDELSTASGLTVMEIRELVEYGVLTPVGEVTFSATCVACVRQAARLQRDLIGRRTMRVENPLPVGVRAKIFSSQIASGNHRGVEDLSVEEPQKDLGRFLEFLVVRTYGLGRTYFFLFCYLFSVFCLWGRF